MIHQEIYNAFIEKTPYLSIMQTQGIFETAPNITDSTKKYVTNLFNFSIDERILLIRKNGSNTYLVITTLGLYHNIGGKSFCLKWEEISSVNGSSEEYLFMRNKRIVFGCSPAYVLFGFYHGSSICGKFLTLLKTFPTYRFAPSPEAKQVAASFKKAFSALPDYLMYDVSQGDRFTYNDLRIPDTESILHYRYTFVHSGSFCVTDQAIYFVDTEDRKNSFSIRWDTVHSAGREGRNICFYDKRGNTAKVPINNVVNRRKGLFEKEERLLKDVDLVAKAFSKVLQSVNCISDTFSTSRAVYPKLIILRGDSLPKDSDLYRPRCPFCGSSSYELSQSYYKADTQARNRHDLQDLASSLVSVAMGGEPSRSCYDSTVTPQYICHKCHKSWKMDWKEEG